MSLLAFLGCGIKTPPRSDIDDLRPSIPPGTPIETRYLDPVRLNAQQTPQYKPIEPVEEKKEKQPHGPPAKKRKL